MEGCNYAKTSLGCNYAERKWPVMQLLRKPLVGLIANITATNTKGKHSPPHEILMSLFIVRTIGFQHTHICSFY